MEKPSTPNLLCTGFHHIVQVPPDKENAAGRYADVPEGASRHCFQNICRDTAGRAAGA